METVSGVEEDGSMTIYKLEQVSWGGQTYSDFGLPKTLGYYASERLVKAAIAVDRKRKAVNVKLEDRTLDNDYQTTAIEVIEFIGQ